jgi:hypothetical protein
MDFKDWSLVATFIHNGEHKTLEGLEKIRKIKSRMNTKREY